MNPSDALAVAAFAGLAFFASLLGFVVLGRAADRHRRGVVRARVQQLVIEWRRFARTGNRPRQVRAQARSVGEALFWSAFETLALELDRAQMLTLSDALQRTAHVRAERRALRDDSPWRRELAARRLGLVHCGDSRRALRRALEQGPESVAFHAAFALAHQRDRWALQWILDHPAYFSSRPPRARTALLRAFGRGATPILAQRLVQGVGDVGLERSIVERLGAARHLPAAAAMRARAASNVLELRIAAVRALSQLDPAANLDVLMGALTDSAWEVRAQAARALGESGVSEAVPVLARALSDRAWWVRRHSAYALAKLGLEGNAALRGEALASPDRYAREMALEVVELSQVRTSSPSIGPSTASAVIEEVDANAVAPVVEPPPAEPERTELVIEDLASPEESSTTGARPYRPRTPAEITAALRAAARRKRSA